MNKLEKRLKIIEDQIIPSWLIIFLFCVVLVATWFAMDNLQSQIDALPHKVCHNETYLNNTILCEYQVTNGIKTDDICTIKQERKEVCEIK
jgi:ascorbate-specific PTS system EIIC-type component UlaA